MNTELWERVVKLLENQADTDAVFAVLSVLLTPEEQDAIGSRLAIMRALLSEEESQREISARLEVSIAKVTRCSNYLKRLNEAEKSLIKG